MSPQEQRYLAGYNAGRTACINLGSSDAARLQLLDPHLEPAYRAGWEWACYDWDDANGLRSVPMTGGATSAPPARAADAS